MLYLVGSPLVTDHVGNDVASWLRGIGTGSRFESITRGVLDFRDLYYYASLILAFLALNVFALERQRWGERRRSPPAQRVADGNRTGRRESPGGESVARELHVGASRRYEGAPVFDLSSNRELHRPVARTAADSRLFLVENASVAGAAGAAAQRPADRIRSSRPRQSAGRSRRSGEESRSRRRGEQQVRHPANPFQVADRHQSSLVNSYFDVLVQYGDQFEVLGFRDLIEVKVAGESDLDVQLRNPEYDITRTIKKVLYGFSPAVKLFSSIPKPLKFVGYVLNDRVLPAQLTAFKETVAKVLDGYATESGGKLTVEFVDPDAGNGAVAKEIREKYGFRPMAASLFDTNTFYFYLTLDGGASTVVQIPLPDDLTEEGLKRSMDAAFKRFATGYLKSVALMAPETPAYMQGMGGGNQYSQLADTLTTDHNVERTQLTEGRVPEGAEVLVVADPQQLNDKQVFAIDQFLMQGGTVMLAASPLAPSFTQQSLTAAPRNTGLADWLSFQGIDIRPSFVMDPLRTRRSRYRSRVRRAVSRSRKCGCSIIDISSTCAARARTPLRRSRPTFRR